MTEEEAKQKWCPFARVIDVIDEGQQSAVGAAVNRFSPHEPATPCLGSGCMAWRLSGSAAHQYGYCGLAGEP